VIFEIWLKKSWLWLGLFFVLFIGVLRVVLEDVRFFRGDFMVSLWWMVVN
jgi:hypothetical protein